MKKYYTLNGRKATAPQWAKLAGISRQAMYKRLEKVSSPEDLEAALTQEDCQGKSFKPNDIPEQPAAHPIGQTQEPPEEVKPLTDSRWSKQL